MTAKVYSGRFKTVVLLLLLDPSTCICFAYPIPYNKIIAGATSRCHLLTLLSVPYLIQQLQIPSTEHIPHSLKRNSGYNRDFNQPVVEI